MFPDEMISVIGKVAFLVFAICAMCMSRAFSADSVLDKVNTVHVIERTLK